MENIFRASVYTPLDIADSHTAKRLWSVLDDPTVAPRRFDSIERARLDFDSRNFKPACDIYSAEDVLFVRGSNAGFKAMFSQLTDTLAKWTFWWNLEAMAGPTCDSWLNWLYELSRKLPPYYGYACSVAEYEAKHEIVDADETGSTIRTVGVSAADFQRFLPGVYWITIFGMELVDHFGPKLQSLPNTQCVRITPSQTAVLLNSPVTPKSMNERLRTETHLAELLGSKYFFDRARVDNEYELVPPLARTMREASE
ncbi:hypothetical protein [Streptomyces sp. NPDC048312]